MNNWRAINCVPEEGIVLFCDRYGNQWVDTCPGSLWEKNGCGFPPMYWRELPSSPNDLNAVRDDLRNFFIVSLYQMEHPKDITDPTGNAFELYWNDRYFYQKVHVMTDNALKALDKYL